MRPIVLEAAAQTLERESGCVESLGGRGCAPYMCISGGREPHDRTARGAAESRVSRKEGAGRARADGEGVGDATRLSRRLTDFTRRRGGESGGGRGAANRGQERRRGRGGASPGLWWCA